ncbi:MAG: hypothetical protein HUJ25_12875 [Crocinitomicaceae bacterium]|nr:hypothetical protein [Crocinitomicaceae bacterium]
MKTTLLTALMLIGIASFATNDPSVDTTSNSSTLSIKVVELIKPSCPEVQDGAISIEIVGGQAPYTCIWNTFPNQYSTNATNLASGVYFVDVIDAAGNRTFTSIQLEDQRNMEDHQWILDHITHKDPCAPLDFINTYDFSVNGEMTDWETVTSLQPGIYTIQICNASDCKLEEMVQIFEYEEVNINYEK